MTNLPTDVKFAFWSGIQSRFGLIPVFVDIAAVGTIALGTFLISYRPSCDPEDDRPLGTLYGYGYGRWYHNYGRNVYGRNSILKPVRFEITKAKWPFVWISKEEKLSQLTERYAELQADDPEDTALSVRNQKRVPNRAETCINPGEAKGKRMKWSGREIAKNRVETCNATKHVEGVPEVDADLERWSERYRNQQRGGDKKLTTSLTGTRRIFKVSTLGGTPANRLKVVGLEKRFTVELKSSLVTAG
ncbi:hypothetical protein B0H19DRAFT_1241513 [Mycena capillaripes]|nr:hypothetical protein B0H19DRAFT_1241513 [Mycena capillaripes]